MPHPSFFRFASALIMSVCSTMSIGEVRAQGFGQQPSYGGQPFGQAPAGPKPSSNTPFPFGQPGSGGQQGNADAPSLVGAWSGQTMTQNGPVQQTDYFGPDGNYVSVARLQNGFTARIWGQYRVTPINQVQLRLDLQAQGWLPQQLCRQEGSGQPSCSPFQIPQTDSTIVSFLSPTALVSVSQTMPNTSITESRDQNPTLLQAQVQQQFVLRVPVQQPTPSPSYQPGAPGPVVVPYQPIAPRYTGPKCDDLQQRRICNINDGHLVSSGGCLVCVSP